MIRTILQDGDPILRRVAQPVILHDLGIISFVEDLLDTVFASRGLGLAAPQIGISQRVIVVAWPNWPHPEVMVNPKITWRSNEEISFGERCLSVPDREVHVLRSAQVELEYVAPLMSWSKARTRLSDVPAVIAQHEIDHLDGKLITDHAWTPKT